MIYEVDDFMLDNGKYSLVNDSRYITVSAYLKGLHWHDKPTSLMPRDAVYLTAARRFYAGLTEDDQLIIDSFSDDDLYGSMNKSQRDKRFNYLCRLFMCQMNGTTFLLPEVAEKGNNNEPN